LVPQRLKLLRNLFLKFLRHLKLLKMRKRLKKPGALLAKI
jgi:hypothetical protein